MREDFGTIHSQDVLRLGHLLGTRIYCVQRVPLGPGGCRPGSRAAWLLVAADAGILVVALAGLLVERSLGY